MHKDWLKRRVIDAEAKEWRTDFEKMETGDEIWEFCSPPDKWRQLCGRGGVALVRNGEIADSSVTEMN